MQGIEVSEEGMTSFPWEVWGLLHEREHIRLILKKIGRFASLAHEGEEWREEAHVLCMQVGKSQDAGDF